MISRSTKGIRASETASLHKLSVMSIVVFIVHAILRNMPKGHEKEPYRTSQNSAVDNVKDSKDVTNVLHILDSYQIRTNPFGANVAGDNSYRRAERIGAALHLITNHVPETEPLRLSIREGALRLMSVILELRSGFRAPASERGQAALADIRILVSHIRLLAVAGYISVQNAGAITEALDELGSLLTAAQRSSLSEQVTISRDDLTPPAQEPPRHERRHAMEKRTSYRTPTREVRRPPQESGGARAAQILEILKLGGALGIKDIAANLPQYSEKMIQRELAHLVATRAVEKEGEKRWSRYRINV